MRPLKADDIDVRIGQVGDGYISLLLYKDARVDRQMLDETYGAFNWQCDYKELKGNMYCGIGVWNDQSQQWVWKWDCGTESQTEKEKGEASDAFKRAGFRWGIGIELYTSPRIYLEMATDPIGNNKYKVHNMRDTYGMYVSRIETVNGKIEALDIAQKVKGRPDMIVWSTTKGKAGTTV